MNFLYWGPAGYSGYGESVTFLSNSFRFDLLTLRTHGSSFLGPVVPSYLEGRSKSAFPPSEGSEDRFDTSPCATVLGAIVTPRE